MPATVREITSLGDFPNLQGSPANQLLVFFNAASDDAQVQRYRIIATGIAQDAARPLEIYLVRSDQVTLSYDDADRYQLCREVVCCTTVSGGKHVMERAVNPLELTLRQMVLNLFA
jgi:hypothetical protein